MTDSVAEFNTAVAGRLDVWVPACGGRETPFLIEGQRLLYCFNPALGRHAYYSLDQDLVLERDELPDCLR